MLHFNSSLDLHGINGNKLHSSSCEGRLHFKYINRELTNHPPELTNSPPEVCIEKKKKKKSINI